MNALVSRNSTPALAMPSKLADAVLAASEPPRRYGAAGEEKTLVIGGAPVRPSGEVISQARGALPSLERALAAAPAHVIEAWLKRVNTGVRNPRGRDDFGVSVAGILAACGDAPASCWNEETLKIGLRKWQFFPSAADVSEVIDAAAKPIRRQVEMVRKFANAEDSAGRPMMRRKPPTDDDRSYVAARVAEIKRNLARGFSRNV